MTPTLFLIGARAAGKTSCGRVLAARLGRPFFDTDVIVQERAGLSVAQIVEREGWAGFRQRESGVLRDLATGLGGAGGGGGPGSARPRWWRPGAA